MHRNIRSVYISVQSSLEQLLSAFRIEGLYKTLCMRRQIYDYDVLLMSMYEQCRVERCSGAYAKKYSLIPLLRPPENKVTPLLRPAFASPKWGFPVVYIAPDEREYQHNYFSSSEPKAQDELL